MPAAGTVIVVLTVGFPAALLAGWFGARGARAIWPVMANVLWPACGAALLMVVTNSDDVAYRLDAPALTGLMLGGTLSALSAPLWLGGYWAGRQTQRVHAG